jgi:hypothetical protein
MAHFAMVTGSSSVNVKIALQYGNVNSAAPSIKISEVCKLLGKEATV